MKNSRNQNYKQHLHARQNLHFEFKTLNTVLLSTALETVIATNVYLVLFLALINISITLLSKHLSQSNTHQHCVQAFLNGVMQ